jgi:hypothetical protein
VVRVSRSAPFAIVIAALTSACHGDDRQPTVVGSNSPSNFAELAILAGGVVPPALNRPTAIAMCPTSSDPGGGLGFFCVVDGHRILRVSGDTGEVTLIAGFEDHPLTKDGVGADAGFSAVADIASDFAGALYVLDGCAVRKIVVETQVVTTIAPNVNPDCGSADGIVTGASVSGPSYVHYCMATKSLVVSDGPALRQVDITTGVAKSVLGPSGQPWASSSGATGPVICGATSIFVADGSVIQRLVLDTGSWQAMPGQYSAGSAITSLSADQDYLYTVQGAAMWRLEMGTNLEAECLQNASSTGAGVESSLGCPTRIAAGRAVDIYATDPCTHSVQLIDCDDVVETTFVAGGRLTLADGDAMKGRFAWPSGLTTDSEGDVFVVDVDSIRRVSPSGDVSTLAKQVLTGSTDNGWPIGIVSDEAGALYVADAAGHTIRKVDAKTGAVSSLPSPQHQLNLPEPTALTIDLVSHTLYVGDVLDHTIRSIGITTGKVTLVAGQPYAPGSVDGDSTRATLFFPAGLALNGRSLLVADSGARTIRAVNLDTGQLQTIAGAPGVSGTATGAGLEARFVEPIAIALAAPDRFLVADRLAGTVSNLELANGEVTKVTRVLGAGASGAVLPPPANTVGASPGQLYLPQAIAFGTNELLIAVPNAVVVAR